MWYISNLYRDLQRNKQQLSGVGESWCWNEYRLRNLISFSSRVMAHWEKKEVKKARKNKKEGR